MPLMMTSCFELSSLFFGAYSSCDLIHASSLSNPDTMHQPHVYKESAVSFSEKQRHDVSLLHAALVQTLFFFVTLYDTKDVLIFSLRRPFVFRPSIRTQGEKRMPVLHLLRHGTLPPNPERRFIGQQDIPLSEKGRREALFWHDEFSTVSLAGVWTSDLSRCRETTSIILDSRSIPVHIDAAFREISLGAWEGLTKTEVESRFPGGLDARGCDFWKHVPCGGESFAMLSRRVMNALCRCLSGLGPQDEALLVAHAGVNRMILMHHMALSMKDFFSIPQPCASCTSLFVSPEDLDRLQTLC